jgi:hypothetical protein
MSEEEEEDTKLWRDWRKQIADDLDKHRPDRYDQGETDWMSPVIARARGRMPIDDALVILKHAEREVKNQEGLANKRGNKQAREWYEGKQPLDWKLLGPCPLIVGITRIRADAVTVQEVYEAGIKTHAENLANFNRAELAVAGYEELRQQATKQGFEQLSLLGDLPPRRRQDDDQAQAV